MAARMECKECLEASFVKNTEGLKVGLPGVMVVLGWYQKHLGELFIGGDVALIIVSIVPGSTSWNELYLIGLRD